VTLLATALLLGLGAAGMTFVVRAVLDSAKKEWLLEKPFSCDLCMSWWSSIALFVVHGDWAKPVSLVLASTAVSVLAVKAANRLAT
jgi:hypothetical protein